MLCGSATSQRLATRRVNQLFCLPARFIDFGDDDTRAQVSQNARGFLADALSGACDDDDFALQFISLEMGVVDEYERGSLFKKTDIHDEMGQQKGQAMRLPRAVIVTHLELSWLYMTPSLAHASLPVLSLSFQRTFKMLRW